MTILPAPFGCLYFRFSYTHDAKSSSKVEQMGVPYSCLMLHPSTSYRAGWIFIHLRHRPALTQPQRVYNQKLGASVCSTLLDDFALEAYFHNFFHKILRTRNGNKLYNLFSFIASSFVECRCCTWAKKLWLSLRREHMAQAVAPTTFHKSDAKTTVNLGIAFSLFQVKPFCQWEKLDMSSIERRKLLCSVTFHIVAITCVVWSLYILIDRTADEIKMGDLKWPFWTKLVVVAIGFTGGLVFMYIQCKVMNPVLESDKIGTSP